MKRRAGFVLAALLAGFLVNCGVCWLCAGRPWPRLPNVHALPQPVPDDPAGLWLLSTAAQPGRERLVFVVRHDMRVPLEATQRGAVNAGHDGDPAAVLPAWSSVRLEELLDSVPRDAGGRLPTFFFREEQAVGWPWRAGRSIAESLYANRQWMSRVVSGIPVSEPSIRGASGRRMLPLRPLVLGTMLNSILYGGVVLLVPVLFLLGRRWWRRRAGRCADCGYELRGEAARCPECGAKASMRPRVQR